MPHTPFHFEGPFERQRRQEEENRQKIMEAGYGGGIYSRSLYRHSKGNTEFNFLNPNINKTVESLKERGFSDNEIKKLFADIDKNPDDYGVQDRKVFIDENEFNRYVMAYVDESSQLYQQTIDTENEMKREEADARLQREFDKAVSEATRPTEEEAGLVAERRRMKAKSQEYVGSKGGVSMQQARKSGAVMIPQRRPM